MYYQVAKYIAAMNAVLRNEAEVIILTGGIVYNDEAVDGIKRYSSWLKNLMPFTLVGTRWKLWQSSI